MSSVNKAILIGNLGRDPEVRYTQGGDTVVNMAVATSERWTDKRDGERREKTEWHRVVVFDQNIADVAQKYLRKGTKVYLEGQLQTRKWTDSHGVERYTTEVVLQRFRSTLTILAGGQRPDGESTGTAATGASAAAGSPSANDPQDLDDDIPF